MRQTFLKNLTFLVALTGVALFSGPGQAQSVSSQPNFIIHLYAVDGANGGPISASTQKINVGAILINNSPTTYQSAFLKPNGCVINNKNANNVWGKGVDTYNTQNMDAHFLTQASLNAFSSADLGLVNEQIGAGIFGTTGVLPLPLKNTSAQKGVVVTLYLNVYYNTSLNPSNVQYYTTTVSDVVYMPST